MSEHRMVVVEFYVYLASDEDGRNLRRRVEATLVGMLGDQGYPVEGGGHMSVAEADTG